MARPTQGQQYEIKSGDTLSSIASQAYGDPGQSGLIESANQSQFKSESGELITGAIIIIPVLAEDQAIKNQFSQQAVNNDPDKAIILCEGMEIIASSIRIFRTMDGAADGWTAVVPWVPGEDLGLDKRLAIFAFPRAQVFIGNQRLINGLIYSVQPRLTENGQVKILQGWSYTVDAIDSTLKPPYERKNVTLEQRASELLKPTGIKAVFETETGGAFDRMTASKTDKIFDHLARYASQRGVLISSTVDGDMSFIRSATGKTVGTLEEGTALTASWAASFDGRKRFASYRAVGQSPKKNDKFAIASDNLVPLSRFMTFSVNDTTEGDIQTAADWKRSKQVADSLSIPFNVTNFYAPDASLWRENTLVTVVSDTLEIPNGFTFLIKSVEYLYEPESISTNLSLVPPQVYTGEPIEIPWRPFDHDTNG